MFKVASDSLNQVGKYIQQTGKNSEFALRRDYKQLKKIERSRDIFDPAIPFEMDFKTELSDTRIGLDLFFNQPPPMKGCRAGCHTAKCETFSEGAGNFLLTLSYPYIFGTVNVYLNGDILDSSQWVQANPSGGQVFVQAGSKSSNYISICYVFGDC